MNIKQILLIGLALISVMIVGCNPAGNLDWIFSIPSDITPSELEGKGFEIMMDNGPHCMFDDEDCFVSIGYSSDNEMEHLGITMDVETFENTTQLKAIDSDSVMIGGEAYKVSHYKESNTVFSSRLGL